MTQVTGPLFDEVGNLLANTTCVVQAQEALVGQDGGGRAKRGVEVTTSGAGIFDADIKPGVHILTVWVQAPGASSVTALVRGVLKVPTSGPVTLEDALDKNATISPGIVAAAIAAAERAEAAADEAEASADAASGSASAAGTSSANALSSAVAAGAQIYPSAAAGIAAVSVGGIFYVPLSPSGGLDIRQKTGASASTSIGQFLPPTQSPTDTTSGRQLQVGDFGLGSPTSLPTWPSGNADDISGAGSGFYSGSPGLGFPIFAPTLYLKRITTFNAAQVQFSNTIRARMTVGSISSDVPDWGPWRTVYDNENILGTVSQSSGVPTGAIIQRGSNSNGEFVRFADGTQICWLTDINLGSPTANGAGTLSDPYRTSEPDWTYPANFVAAPAGQVTIRSNAADGRGRGLVGIFRRYGGPNDGGSMMTIIAYRIGDNTNTDDVFAQLVAVGRWF